MRAVPEHSHSPFELIDDFFIVEFDRVLFFVIIIIIIIVVAAILIEFAVVTAVLVFLFTIVESTNIIVKIVHVFHRICHLSSR